MTQLNQIPIRVGLRKNTNSKSLAFGKYYYEVLNNKTISTRALLNHIMSHGLGIPRSIVQAVLTQVAECLTELMLQGQPVKLDGFGTFQFHAMTRRPIGSDEALAGANPRDGMKGLRLVVIPDNTELDKLTSKSNLEKAAISLEGVIEKKDAGETATGNAKTQMVITPIDVYLQSKVEPEP